jgi:hypothetical protein
MKTVIINDIKSIKNKLLNAKKISSDDVNQLKKVIHSASVSEINFDKQEKQLFKMLHKLI